MRLFRRNKASKDNVDEIPTPAKEGQEEMQVSVVSPESALEKPVLAATVPVDESNSPLCSPSAKFRKKSDRTFKGVATMSTPTSEMSLLFNRIQHSIP